MEEKEKKEVVKQKEAVEQKPQSDKDMKKAFYKYINERITICSFLLLAIVSCFIVYLAFDRSNRQLKESQELIINSQSNQISKINDSFSNLYNSVSKNTSSNDSVFNKIMSDSLFRKTPNINGIQQQKINSYVKSIIIASAVNLEYRNLIHELKKDSTLVNQQILQTQQATKSLLELEFNKIQNEYQALALWGGILTIVFLIFSFYSLIKTDDLLKQGKDGIKELSLIKNSGDKLAEETYKKLNDAQSTIKTNLEEQQKRISQAEEDISKKADNMKKLLKVLNDDFQKELDNKIGDNLKKIENEYNSFQKRWDSLLQEITEASEHLKLEKQEEIEEEDEETKHKP